MTDPIAARVAPTMTVTQALAGASGSATTAKSPTDAMGSDTFLKLLVAQLKYQDPSKPADATAMMGQTAQFQMVEKLQQLADQNTQLLSEQQATSAITDDIDIRHRALLPIVVAGQPGRDRLAPLQLAACQLS